MPGSSRRRSGTLDGMSVTAGDVYKLAGNGGTTATPDGTAGVNANVAGTSEMTLDAAGNVVLAVQSGSSFGDQPRRPGSGGGHGVVLRDLHDRRGPLYGRRWSLEQLGHAERPDLCSQRGSGNLLFTDGAAASANLDSCRVVPRLAVPTVTTVAPTSGPAGWWHQCDDHRHRLHRRHGGRLRHDAATGRHRGQRHLDHGHIAGGHRDGRRHRDHPGRHLGHLGQPTSSPTSRRPTVTASPRERDQLPAAPA